MPKKRVCNGFTMAKMAFISVAKNPAHLNFTHEKIYIRSKNSQIFWLFSFDFHFSHFYSVNIILSIWAFNQFLYMILVVLSQNVIGMGWKMNNLRMYILTWVKFKCAGFLATLMKAVLAVVKPLRSRFCGYRLQKRFNYSQSLNWLATFGIL